MSGGLPAASERALEHGRAGGWYWFGWNLSRVVFTLLFQRRVEGRGNIPARGPFMVCANHQSFLDPPCIGSAFPYPIWFFARKSLQDNRFMGWMLPRLNVIPIDQDRPDLAGMRAALRVLKAGVPLLVFPEGGRTPDGGLQAGQPGVGLLIAKSGVPVLPVRIRGAHEAWARGSKRIRLHPIRVSVGPLIPARDLAPAPGLDRESGYRWIADRVMERIGAL